MSDIEIICNTCGSNNIKLTQTYRRTVRPKGVKANPRKKISYGYKFTKCECECGNIWEVR